MRDEGHIAPAASPAVFVPPVLIRTLPCSFALPALVRTPPCSFVPSCTPSYPPPPRTLRTCLRSFVAAAAVGVGALSVSAVPAPALFVMVHATRSCSFGLYLRSFVLVRTSLGSFICIKCKVSIHHN